MILRASGTVATRFAPIECSSPRPVARFYTLPRTHVATLAVFAIVVLSGNGEASQGPAEPSLADAQSGSTQDSLPIDGPPAPIPPAVISRDASGRATIRAVRISTPLRIDGQLNEAVYATVPSMSDFIQTEPAEGSPAKEKTEVWVFFDDEYVYIVGRCWETHPERLVANEMRRDNFGIVRNDNSPWVSHRLWR